jgi:mediator of RNA polymerase II transcription subunit 7
MADQAAQQQQVPMKAPFPAPPPFYHHFTKQNLADLRRRRKEAGVSLDPEALVTTTTNDSQQDVDILSLPTELRFLLPPPPPSDGKFKAFGFARDLSAPERSLADIDIQQLFPDHPAVRLNPQAHLISLARSQLTTFLALIGNLSQNPADGWEPPTKDLDVLTYNMTDLVNQYRPHQARETLILMMEERVERMRKEVRDINEARRRMEELIGGLQGGESSEGGDSALAKNGMVESGLDAGSERRRAKQRAAWRAIEALDNDQGH